MIFDIEADGLLDRATKIHVMAYEEGGEVKHTHDYDKMRELFLSATVLVGHNIVCYDIPLVEKILGIKVSAKLVDTLGLSWVLRPKRIKHGLEGYGEDYGVPKPEIDNWENLSPEEYAHRCVEDVKINKLLAKDLFSELANLYGTEIENRKRFVEYITFKLHCLRKAEESKFKLDIERCEANLAKIIPMLEEKIAQLTEVMPKVAILAKRSLPAKPYKKDGTLSATGAKWFKLLKDEGLPEDHKADVEVVTGYKEANPGSTPQVKDWLFGMGWVPETFKFTKDSQGNEKSVPQVRVDGELCDSVRKLIPDNPEVELLDGMTVLAHRKSIFEGFLRDVDDDGFLVAGAAGFTNTLRLKHRVLVNLPGVDKPWGEEIRGCLVARDGYKVCGSDMSSLEDNCKKHYMYPYDPDYVDEMSDPMFDPHLDLATFAGATTKTEILKWKSGEAGAKDLKPLRKNFKVANYSCIYGVGAPTLSRTLGSSVKEAQSLIDAYWGRNWSVKEVANDATVRTINGQMWLLNPVSGFWYSLRAQKDIFSTLNQGTGVYCFDMWIQELFSVREQINAQFHDEIVIEYPEHIPDYKVRDLLDEAISRVNDKLQLNVTLSVDMEFGRNYAEVH